MYNQKPYEEKSENKQLAEYIENFKKKYFESSGFKKYRRKCERVMALVNQEFSPGEQTTRFGLKLGITRATHDSMLDAFEDIFDTDIWIRTKPRIEVDAVREEARRIEYYGNNMLYGINYQRHVINRCLFIPVFGWSIATSEYHYAMGNVVKPKAETEYEGGFIWEEGMDAIQDGVKCEIIHTFNWFGDPNQNIFNQKCQGYIKRWELSDVMSAKGKIKTTYAKDENGEDLLDELGQPVIEKEEPLYNMNALKELEKKMTKGETTSDDNYYTGMNKANDEGTGYCDVTYYIGKISGCKGFEDDPNTYVIECYEGNILRMYEHPVDNPEYYPITHAQTHPQINCVFPRSPLDAIVPHSRVNDMLCNMALDGVSQSMSRTMLFDESDFINPEVLKQPQGALNLLYLRTAKGGNFTLPRIIEDNRSGALSDLNDFVKFMDYDRQRSGGSTDQELGIGSGGANTATQARILASQLSRSTRAMVRRIVRDALIPEMKRCLLLSLMHSDPQEKVNYSENGEEYTLTPDMMRSYLERTDIVINDNIIRDRDLDAVERMEFFQASMQFSQHLMTPKYGMMAIRELGKEKGVPKDVLDRIFPEPSMGELQQQPGQPQAQGQGQTPQGGAEDVQADPDMVNELAEMIRNGQTPIAPPM